LLCCIVCIAKNSCDLECFDNKFGCITAISLQGGRTPLHEAAFHGRVAVTQLLLRAGADKSLVDWQGMTTADLAGERGHELVAHMCI